MPPLNNNNIINNNINNNNKSSKNIKYIDINDIEKLLKLNMNLNINELIEQNGNKKILHSYKIPLSTKIKIILTNYVKCCKCKNNR